jgi:AcrR family transcriptional regulator
MPARGDHDARREDVSEAVWQVLARCGVGGLTIRSVAAEMGATTGLVSHYFPTKKELVAHARCVAELRTTQLHRGPSPEPGLAALRNAILDVLPLTPEMVAMSKAWVSFWDAAIGDPELAASETIRYENWRQRLRLIVLDAQVRNELDPDLPADDYTVMIGAFAHGLVVQSLFDRKRLPAKRQTALVDRFLAQIGSERTNSRFSK